MPSAVIAVCSVDDEDNYLGSCVCGSTWHLVAEDVVPMAKRWYDALVLRCRGCGYTRRAIFEITSFFEPPSTAWGRQS